MTHRAFRPAGTVLCRRRLTAGAAVLIDDEKDAKKNAKKLAAVVGPLLYEQSKRAAE
jgi:hypothetical protein